LKYTGVKFSQRYRISPLLLCVQHLLLADTLSSKGLSNETYSGKYEKLPNIVIHACKNNTKKVFVKNVWPANLALFCYVSTHCVEKVEWLDYNRYSQLTWWCSGYASALGARGPGFNPQLRQGFLCMIFCFVVVFLLFCQKHIVTKVCNSFYNFNLFSIS